MRKNQTNTSVQTGEIDHVNIKQVAILVTTATIHYMLDCPINNQQIQVVYTGYGKICQKDQNQITLTTAKPKNKKHTHGTLVVSTKTNITKTTTTVTLNRQLRKNPNPWESPWLIFGYHNPKQFYYLALKTNGWELGKKDTNYPGEQRFLKTENSPKTHLNTAKTVTIEHHKNRIVLIINKQKHVYTDKENPYKPAKFGFYTEDAQVTFKNKTLL